MTKHSMIIEHIRLLQSGERISVRTIAEKMDVSEGTAYRAIKEAESEGLVSTIPRVGTVRLNTREEKDIERLTFSEVLNIVEGNLLSGRDGLGKYLNNFIIGAMTPDVVVKYMENNNLLIVGNREEMFDLALEKNCAILITGGFDCSDEVKKKAGLKKLPVMNCSYDTFTVATLINNAINSRMVKKDIVMVEDIMVQNPFVLKTGDTVGDWRRLVRDTSHTRFPVVDNHGKVVGIITTKDITDQDNGRKIETLMTPGPITVGPKTSVAYIAHIMIWEGIELLPVVDGRKLVGIVSRQDVIKALQYRKNQPQVGKTMEESLLDNFDIEYESDQVVMRGRVEPFMLNNIGGGSWGALAMLLSLAASSAIRRAKNNECFINTFTVYSIKPVQLGDNIEVVASITGLGRNSSNLDICIIREGLVVMKAILTASHIKR
jgi:predicted transcriptional regulator